MSAEGKIRQFVHCELEPGFYDDAGFVVAENSKQLSGDDYAAFIEEGMHSVEYLIKHESIVSV
jgi:hypothetical protein